MWDINPFLFGVKVHICEILPGVSCCAGGGDFGKITSLPLLPVLMWPFIFCCGGANQLVFRSFFRGNCSLCDYLIAVSMVEMSGSSHATKLFEKLLNLCTQTARMQGTSWLGRAEGL